MQNLQLSAHFNLREFRCQKDYKDCPYCGGSIRITSILIYQVEVYKLEILRWKLSEHYGEEVEIIIGRGDSCNMRNAEVSSCIPPELSWHFRGCATDCFARIKSTKKVVSMVILCETAREIWGSDNALLEFAHLHITLARV